MGNGSELWTKFKEALMAEVRSLAQEGLLGQFWGTETGRTKMYTERIVPGIGRRLDLSYQGECMRIDFLYRLPWPTEELPRIWLEIENDPKATYMEIGSLCWVRSPLKVLITVAPWSTDRPLREHLKNDVWLGCIKKSWQEWRESDDTVYGFAIGEKKAAPNAESLFLHFFSASADGNAGPEEEHFVGKF